MTKAHPVEGDVKNAVKKLLTECGWFWFMPPANQYGANGIADILALKNGRFLAIETKLKKSSASPNQEIFLQNVRDHGGEALVVNMAGLHAFTMLLTQMDAQDASAR